MSTDRQLRLFRRRRKPAPAPEPGLGRQPSRLAFGEPESLAFKRASEEEAERRRREEAERLRRERAALERQRRVSTEIPAEQEVVQVLRDELSRDIGMPPRRERIEERVLDELAARYPAVPRQHVQEVFSRARSAGLVRYQGRRWSWEGREEEGERAASLARAAAAVASHAVVLRPSRERALLGAGTLVVVAGEPAVLTSRDVWSGARGIGRPLELFLSRESRLEVDLELVDAALLGAGLVPLTDVGPDLALLRLPGMTRHVLAHAEKAAYSLDEEAELPLAAETIHALAPSPLALRPVLLEVAPAGRQRSAAPAEPGGAPVELEHVDVEPRGETAPWLPGAGLWAVSLDVSGQLLGQPILEGVALFELPGRRRTVRCHGRASIADLAERVRPVRS